MAISGDSSGSRCGYNTSDSTVNVTSGTITGFTYTPITVKSRGPGSYYSEFSVVFSLDHGIPYGGKITVVIDANWYPT